MCFLIKQSFRNTWQQDMFFFFKMNVFNHSKTLKYLFKTIGNMHPKIPQDKGEIFPLYNF